VATACDGVASGTATVTEVTIDSRQAGPGSLFVAITGEHQDGHDFLADAVERGAAAVLSETGRLPAGMVGVEVDDTVTALRKLGEVRRTEITAPVVAVTGSSGKTTTKDLIAAVLGVGTHAAPRSFNNELGVPLTVLGSPDDASSVVLEVGSRGAGHIAALARVMRPDVAVITNIGRAHLEMFGSLDAVRAAKWELIECLGTDGVAVLPAADTRLVGDRIGAMVTFGEEQGDVMASDVEMDASGIAEFDLSHAAATVRVRMPMPGRHQPLNAAAAVAVAVALGRDFVQSGQRLCSAPISPWRMELSCVQRDGGEIVVVNDSYNANPDSMAAALTTVAAMPGRHFAVLGKMHELGATEAAAHHEVGALAASLGFSVIAVGEDPGIAGGAASAAVSVRDQEAAVEHLLRVVRPGDVVLVKGSRAAGLERIASGLTEVPA
jgi:UDP-N-acetylmuramoyl-tripeptide--D-alanyl-D-alanine ligase